MQLRVPLAVAQLALVVTAGQGCFFDFDRALGLSPGDVSGRAVRARDPAVPAGFAQAITTGVPVRRRADSLGVFGERSLPPGGYATFLSDDVDGDGWPERTGQRSFVIRTAAHRTGLFGEEERDTFVVLGDVLVEGAVEVRGKVEASAGGGAYAPAPGARVVVVREALLEVGANQGPSSAVVEQGVEAETAADVEGAFRLPRVGAGSFSLVVVIDPDGPGGQAPQVSPPVAVVAIPGEPVDVGTLRVNADALLQERSVTLTLSPPPSASERVLLRFMPPGVAPAPPASSELQSDGPYVFAGASSIDLRAPLGLYDVHAFTSDGRRGALLQRASSPPGDDVVRWGTLVLSGADPCEGSDDSGGAIIDCDGDGLQRLPSPDDGRFPAVAAPCGEACKDAFGAAAGGASCAADGEVWDCDDDGDGQPDVTEPPACRSVAAGDDRDGDGLCSVVDPFPQCAENDPAALRCRADRDDTFTPPPLWPDFGGPPLDGGPDPDAGPVDSGPNIDAGPVDAGRDDDAGNLDAGLYDDAGADDAGLFDAGLDSDAGPTGFAGFLFDTADVFVARAAPAPDDGFLVTASTSSTLTLNAACAVPSLGSGSSALFVARYSGSGECLWLRTILGDLAPQGPASSGDYAYHRALAANDTDLFVIGEYQGNITLGDDDGGAERELANLALETHTFIARYRMSDGALLTVTRIVPSDSPSASLWVNSAAAFPSGALVMTGQISNTVAFHPDGTGQMTLVAGTTGDLFVARYGNDNEPQWGTLGDTANSSANGQWVAASVDANGIERAVVAAYVGDTLFNNTAGEQIVRQTNRSARALIGYDELGTRLWSFPIHSSFFNGTAFAVAPAGDVALAHGTSQGEAIDIESPARVVVFNHTPAAYSAGYLAVLDPTTGELRAPPRVIEPDPSGDVAISSLSYFDADELGVAMSLYGPLTLTLESGGDVSLDGQFDGAYVVGSLLRGGGDFSNARWARQGTGGCASLRAGLARAYGDMLVFGQLQGGECPTPRATLDGVVLDPGLNPREFVWRASPSP